MEALVSYLVAASMVKSPENARFIMKLKKLIAEHPDQEKLESKKLEALNPTYINGVNFNFIISKSFKYDVFLSFRGEDTRNNFVSHVYKALEQQGIQTYKNDEKIKKGETIDTQLIKSIEDSRFFIIVFSKDYAGSSWCLDELVKIMECQKTTEQTAYPVFYDVEPTEVRKQSGAVEKAFEEHKNKEAAGKWREALKEAADLAGWELKKTANGVDGNLVGMEMRINEVLSSLEFGTEDVRMIGIKGFGGGGKTTLATAIFNQISHQFKGSSFVENVREVSENSLSGLKELQKQILTDIFSDQNITVSSVSGGKNKMVQMMRRKKVLVVLDDVDTDQLEALAGDLIGLSREAELLLPHEMSKYAFGREIPVEGYEHLSRKVVQYAAGLPLTIKVLGSFLCSQKKPQWNDALERLETIPLNETMMILELSYNSLEEDYKDIFLDVACLLKGWYKKDAIRALESCGFRAINGLRVLEQKSLITISKDGKLGMHDHIEEMGMNPNEPERHGRLWIEEEIVDIMANNMGTQATECLKLEPYGLTSEISMKGLANMKKLRYLHLYIPGCLPKTFQAKNLVGLEMENTKIVQLWDDAERKVFLKLRLDDCRDMVELQIPRKCHKLVNLELSGLWLTTLQHGITLNLETLRIKECIRMVELQIPAECPKLITLDLQSLELTTLHLGIAPNLETLRIKYCFDMAELRMPAECPKLVTLVLKNLKFTTLHLGITPNLETLSLLDCTYMVKLRMPAKLVTLKLYNSKLKTLHLGITPNLKTLSLRECTDMVELRMPAECPELVTLILDYSKSTDFLQRITPNPYMVGLQIPADCLKLVHLNLCNLKLTTLHLGITPNLKTLRLDNCTDMVELHIPAECLELVNLNLFHLKLRTLHLGVITNLETLSVTNCTHMVKLHMPDQCPKLIALDLSNLKLRTLHLGITPNHVTLNLCTDMVELHIPAECPKLVNLYLTNCLKLRTLHLGITPNLKKLNLWDCTDMVELHMRAECPKLVNLELNNNAELRTLDLRLDETTPTTNALLLKLIGQLDYLATNGNPLPTVTNTSPVAFHTSPSPTHFNNGPAHHYSHMYPRPIYPKAFPNQPAHPHAYYPVAGPPSFAQPPAQPIASGLPTQPVIQTACQPASLLGQATTLPHTFNAVTLHDTGAWNMNTGASSHLNNSVNSLSEIFNTTGDLYPVTVPSPIPHAFLVSQHTWHQRLGHPGGEVL
ncbi:Toll/interleukin-1 receptor domain-containing protein [Tanacetum coccineum]